LTKQPKHGVDKNNTRKYRVCVD